MPENNEMVLIKAPSMALVPYQAKKEKVKDKNAPGGTPAWKASEEFADHQATAAPESLALVVWQKQHDAVNKQETRNKRMAAVEIPTFIPEGTIVKEFDPPAEPELSDKDKKKEAKKHRDANKRLRKESGSDEHATEYSGSVLEIYREKMKEFRELDAYSDELNSLDEIEETEETEETEEEQSNDVDVLQIYEAEINPNIFEPEYFGAHFDVVFDRMQHFKEILNAYGPGTKGYSSLSRADRLGADELAKTYELMEKCFTAALHCHNIYEDENAGKAFEGDLKYIDKDKAAKSEGGKTPEEQIGESISELKKHLSEHDASVASEVQTDIDKRMKTEEKELIKKRDQIKKEHPDAGNDFYSDESYELYKSYEKALNARGQEKEIAESREEIKAAMESYKKYSMMQAKYQMLHRSYLLLAKEVFQGNDGTSVLPKGKELYALQLLRRKKKIDGNREIVNQELRELKIMLNHFLLGNSEQSETTRTMMLKFGIKKVQEEQKKAVTQSALAVITVTAREGIFQSRLQERFPDEKAYREIFAKIKDEPFRMLMRQGQDDRNDIIIDLMLFLHRKELKGIIETKDIRKLLLPKQELFSVDEKTAAILTEKVAREYVKPGLDMILQDKLLRSDDISLEQLIAMQPKLIEQSFTGAMLNRLAQLPSETMGLNLRDVLLEKKKPSSASDPDEKKAIESMNRLQDEALQATLLRIDADLMRARAASILDVDLKSVKDPTAILSEDEKRVLKEGTFGHGSAAERMESFALDQLEKGCRKKDLSQNRLLTNPSVIKWASEASEIKKKLTFKLPKVFEDYPRAEELIGSEKRLEEMKKQGASDEELENAKTENETRIRICYGAMTSHYDRLEEKYGYALPDLSWILLHYQEWQSDLMTAEEDYELLKSDRTVFREDNPTDVRLYMQVEYFRTLKNVMENGVINGVAKHSSTTYNDLRSKDDVQRALSDVFINVVYLISTAGEKQKELSADRKQLIRQKREGEKAHTVEIKENVEVKKEKQEEKEETEQHVNAGYAEEEKRLSALGKAEVKTLPFPHAENWIVLRDNVFKENELSLDTSEEVLFEKDKQISISEIRQSGAINDCYLISVLAGLASCDPEYIKNSLITEDEKDKKYAVVSLYDEKGDAMKIRIRKTGWKGDNRPLWIQLVEKAALVLIGRKSESKNMAAATYRYGHLDGKDWSKPEFSQKTFFAKELDMGGPQLAMNLLFGKRGLHEVLTPTQDPNPANVEQSDKALGKALAWKKAGMIVTASTDVVNKDKLSESVRDIIRSTHVYTVLGEGETISGKRTVRLRDPYGTGDENGEFSVTFEDFRSCFTDVAATGPQDTPMK